MSSSVRAQARAFDDEALTALANAGLIRRARKLADATTVVVEDVDMAEVRVGDELVRFAADAGLGRGDCTCRTVGTCQHLVAAILHLRTTITTTSDADTDTEGADDPSGDDRRDDAAEAIRATEAWLDALDLSAIRAFATTPDIRWALSRLDVLDEREVALESRSGVVVSLPTGVDIRFMGPTFSSAFCDPAGPNSHRQIVLAALLWRARVGHPAPVLPASKKSKPSSIAGRTNVVTTAATASSDAITIGIAHLSGAVVERFESLAIEARGAKLYRLGRRAGGVASGIDDLIERRASADAGALLAELSLVFVLAETALAAERSGELPIWLAGVSRTEYTEIGGVDLLALGAYPWETNSGFAGVTGVFFEAERNRFLELGSGRRQASAQPAEAYRELVGWAGAHSLERMRGQRVTLTRALTSAQGRLSTSGRTSAELGGAWQPAELDAADWDGTMPNRSTRLRGDGIAHWASLRIESSGSVGFDPVRQRLIWPVRSAGCDVVATLDWTTANAAAIGSIEQLEHRGASHMIGRLWSEGGNPWITPVSVLCAGQLIVLAFDTAPETQTARPHQRREAATVALPNRPLERIASRVLQLAERGVDAGLESVLADIAQQASAHGFMVVGRALRSAGTPQARVLRAAHAIEEHRHLRA